MTKKPALTGWAVRFGNDTFHYVEYWHYDPAILTKKQLKTLGILSWKKINIAVKGSDRG